MKPITQLASKVLSAFRKRDQRNLRKLNDEILKSTSTGCDRICFNMAVYSYVLSKVVSKPRYFDKQYEPMLREISRVFGMIVERLDTATEDDILELFTDLEEAISHLEDKDPRFIIDLVTKGRLKMASTFYAQGMSLGVAADMTGLDKQEILDYAGETMMFDRLKDEKTIVERIKIARKFLTG